jgi:hypothetical protein
MQNVLIKLERLIWSHEQIISRYFIRGELSGFAVENRTMSEHNPTLAPCGTYPLSTGNSTELSKQFYYNDNTNQLIGRKDYFKLTDKTGWRPHDLIYIKEIPLVSTIVISWGIEGIGDHTLTLGNVIGYVSGEERVVQNRFNYITIYPMIYTAIKDNKHHIEIMNLGRT